MIKRRFFKVDHGDRDGSDNSSSSSDEDYDNHEVAQVSNDNDSDDEASSASSGSFIRIFLSWKIMYKMFWVALRYFLDKQHFAALL